MALRAKSKGHISTYFKDEFNIQISDKDYIKGSFAALMAKSLNDEGWYQLLTDIDKYENYCEMGSVSSPYIDFPQARLYFCMKIFQKKNLTQTFF